MATHWESGFPELSHCTVIPPPPSRLAFPTAAADEVPVVNSLGEAQRLEKMKAGTHFNSWDTKICQNRINGLAKKADLKVME